MCIDMCIDARTDMCIDMCIDMCVDICADIRINMCVDMCADIDMCGDMCIDMCIDMQSTTVHRPTERERDQASPGQQRFFFLQTRILHTDSAVLFWDCIFARNSLEREQAGIQTGIGRKAGARVYEGVGRCAPKRAFLFSQKIRGACRSA